jgi:adenine-specific DNA-methyltransferase
MLQIATKKDDLVMDFFAGSATTAHAVMELNAEDGGNRKWICVQLPEKCKPDTEAAKAGFVTIADIAKERIRRAGRKIREENADKQLDTGFKVFKLDESNFKVWDTQIDGMAQLEQQLLDFVDNVRPGARSEDLLVELILKTGLELNVAIEAKEAGGGVYHRIGNGSLVICLADKLTEPLLAAMLVDRPEKIIVLDRAFAGNDQLKTNMLLQAEQAGVKEFTII